MSNFYKSITKYNNFTNNKNIPPMDNLVFVFDIDLFNLFMSKFIENSLKLTKEDYLENNIIVSKSNDDKIVGYVLILELTNSTINFMLSNIKFKERIYRSIILFIPEQKEIKNSITKPYFSYFPYFFGEHDNDIKIKNNIYRIYIDIKVKFCLGLYNHLNMEILEINYDFDKNQIFWYTIKKNI